LENRPQPIFINFDLVFLDYDEEGNHDDDLYLLVLSGKEFMASKFGLKMIARKFPDSVRYEYKHLGDKIERTVGIRKDVYPQIIGKYLHSMDSSGLELEI